MRRTVIAVVTDMFFASKIRAAAEALHVEVRFVRTPEQLRSEVAHESPDLILVDLQAEKLDPLALPQLIKEQENGESVQLLGFLSHVENELQQAAVRAGYDKVIPRSVFSRDLGAILRGD
jgi:PleD family two-component response regulator